MQITSTVHSERVATTAQSFIQKEKLQLAAIDCFFVDSCDKFIAASISIR